MARVSAAVAVKVEHYYYYTECKRACRRLHQKVGKRHGAPALQNADAYLPPRLRRLATRREKKIFRSAAGKTQKLTERPIDRTDTFRMIKRRVKGIGLSGAVCNYSFRSTGITAFRASGRAPEWAQEIANRASPKTTGFHDRIGDQITPNP